jgi:hypothetical protein
VFGILSFGRRISQRAPWVGVEWVQAGQGVTALIVEPGSPAADAGLLPGDVLVRVGGKPADSVLRAADAPWRVPAGAAVRMTVRRAGSEFDATIVPVRRHAAPPLYGYLALIGAAFFGSGLVIVLRWPSVRGARIYGVLGLALFAQLVLSQTGSGDTFDWAVHSNEEGDSAMDETWRASDDKHPPNTKRRWDRPLMTFLGNVRDLVHGFGKTGTNADGDPNMTAKSGMG